MSAPSPGPCTAWCVGADIQADPTVAAAITKWLTVAGNTQPEADAICADCATAASEVLFELSGRVYSGQCGPVTVRPVARPVDSDTRGILSPLGWYASSSSSMWAASSIGGAVSHYGGIQPPEIDLWAGPVIAISQVKIDGVVIPSNEYELRDHLTLVRMRPTASSTPTDRWGWPTSQILDLPDTQPGTFSITYTYGQPPPSSGVLGAIKLGQNLALSRFGDTSRLPTRVTTVQRQGVSAMVVDVIDIVKTGRTGIYEVDLFLRSVNPNQADRQSAVWSPDLGRARRVPTP